MRVLIILGLIGVATAAPRQTQRIVGGTDTSVEEYPYMANMQYWYFSLFYQQTCGGTLISERSVLSAAHCYVGHSPISWRVVLGASETSGADGTAYSLDRMITHEHFESSVQPNNDIAIIVLATPATLSSKIALARVAGPDYDIADGTIVTFIGYGKHSFGGPQPSQLQQVQIPTINQEICNNRYSGSITPGMLCCGLLDVGGQDTCTGDSGGPVVHGPNQDILVGVTSWNFDCAHPYYPGVNARVSYYTDWIVANVI